MHFSDFYEAFNLETKENTNKKLVDLGTSKGVFFFQNFFNTKMHPWFHNTGLKRDLIVTMNRLRANHYNLGASLKKINVIDSAACPCGFFSQDIDHIFWDCTLYTAKRINLIKNLEKVKLAMPCSIKSIICKPTSLACKYIHEYLKECELFI